MHKMEALSNRGLKRWRNEDAAVARDLADGSQLLVVADGMGGHADGNVASRVAIEAVIERCEAEPALTPASMLREAFEAANAKVRGGGASGSSSDAGTTLVAAIVNGSRAWVANIGDSRAYLVPAGTGPLQQLTVDHSWVEDQVRAGFLAPGDPLAANRRHLISRAIGLDAHADTDLFGPFELPVGSVLLLCSDGLHGVLDDRDIGNALRESGDSYAAAMIAAAHSRGAPDNVAVALITIRNEAEG